MKPQLAFMIPTPSPINQLRTKCKSSFLNSMLYYNGALLLEKKKIFHMVQMLKILRDVMQI